MSRTPSEHRLRQLPGVPRRTVDVAAPQVRAERRVQVRLTDAGFASLAFSVAALEKAQRGWSVRRLACYPTSLLHPDNSSTAISDSAPIALMEGNVGPLS